MMLTTTCDPRAAGPARLLIALLMLSVPALPGCGGDGPLTPEEEPSLQGESAHFQYFWSDGDEPVDAAYQERHIAWVMEKLGIEPSGRSSITSTETGPTWAG